jgi:3-oxoacyl-[acyl-carrier-protein] synthase-3
LAAKSALGDANLSSEEIELIIVATITPDMQFPSTACIVQDKIGAKKAACFDISAACAGFVYGVVTASAFISEGIYKNALVIGAEKLSSIVDWQDRSTCVLLGDGAGACVLAEVNDGGILSSYLGSDGGEADLLYLPGGGSKYPATHRTVEGRMHFIKMKGNELFKIAVMKMAEAAQKALEKANLTCKDIDWLIPHQANMRILLATAKRMGIDKKKIYVNIERYGNMSSASTAVALCEAAKEKKIKKGDIVVLDAFGGGLVWGACVIRW